jgi:peptide deformylase
MTVDPAKLRIDVYPTEVLRRKADPVDPTPEIAAVAERMVTLMHAAEGIGLAAPQVGLPWRLFVCHVPPPADPPEPPAAHPISNDAPEVFLNPELLSTQGPPEPLEEGCLSLPGIRGDVLRPPVATIRYQTPDGQWHTRTAAGLLARCWMHEMDHLDGVLILDKMTQLGRLRNRTLVRALEKRAR